MSPWPHMGRLERDLTLIALVGLAVTVSIGLAVGVAVDRVLSRQSV